MRRILALARCTHAETLDGLRQDNGRATLVLRRGIVGCVNLQRIVSTTIKPPDLVVGHIRDHLGRFRKLGKERVAHVFSVFGFDLLVFAIDRLFHHLA